MQETSAAMLTTLDLAIQVNWRGVEKSRRTGNANPANVVEHQESQRHTWQV
jgi:hypothetical protein